MSISGGSLKLSAIAWASSSEGGRQVFTLSKKDLDIRVTQKLGMSVLLANSPS